VGNGVLIKSIHVLRETLQVNRNTPLVKAIASEVIVWVQPELLQLVSLVKGVDLVLPLHNGTPEIEYDIDVEVMELPFIFRSTVNSIPTEIPYIYSNPLFMDRDSGSLNIGLVWETGNYDKKRCIPFELLKPIFALTGFNFYILQANAAAAGWQQGFGIHPEEFSLTEYAGVLKGLDLLITVDSMPAHLAGAQGVPVWNLLHAEADWRWMYHINHSPWYPTMKLFRQREAGNWTTVVDTVMNELQRQLMKRAA